MIYKYGKRFRFASSFNNDPIENKQHIYLFIFICVLHMPDPDLSISKYYMNCTYVKDVNNLKLIIRGDVSN